MDEAFCAIVVCCGKGISRYSYLSEQVCLGMSRVKPCVQVCQRVAEHRYL